MTKFIEMTNEETLNIEGGRLYFCEKAVAVANAYETGYATGSSSTNCPVCGVARGFVYGVANSIVTYATYD